ncbi:MAG: MtaA/CmuA family methyltransferase [Synergistaceae bacterium]|jgi:[methyl-Co(III) methanol-specific corrinoid protein]:coenzyme M methyltransferase|nr:MtaA/CmuA family methyltransferase [Synergistaceae bacterium]
MNASTKRVLAALRNETTDCTPVISVCQHATYDVMERVNAPWPQAHGDPEMMAALSGAGAEILGLDAVRVPYCQTVEAEALGAVIKSGGALHLPSIAEHPFKIGDDPEFPRDFLQLGRIPVVLRAVELIKKRFDGSAAVMAGLCGPFSIAASLLGITVLLKTAYKKPEAITPFLELGLKCGSALAEAYRQAGADVIVIEDMMASLDMISPKMYREIVAGYETRLEEAVKLPSIIHICGKLDGIIADVARTGANAVSVESSVNIPAARETLAGYGLCTSIAGAVHPMEVLLEGTPEDVTSAVESSIEDGAALISPGCAVAPGTPTENLIAMVEAGHRYRLRFTETK